MSASRMQTTDVVVVVVPQFGSALTALADELAHAATADEIVSSAAQGLVRLLDRTLVARVFVVREGWLRESAVAGDARVAADRRTPRAQAFEERSRIETPLGRPAGYHLVDLPLVDEGRVFGVLEVAAPAEVIRDDLPALEEIARQVAVAMHRVEFEGRLRSEVAHEASEYFSLGLRVAAVAARAVGRPAAVRGIVRTLERELGLPVVAWRTDARREGSGVIETAGLSWRAKAEVAGRCGVLARGPRVDLLRQIAGRTREVLGAPEVTLIDADLVVFAVLGDVPALEGSGGLFADVVAAIPEPGAFGDGLLDGGSERLRLEQLTEREREVLSLLTEGLGTSDIAARLAISPMTVKTHVQNLLGKLGVRTRLEAAMLATRCGHPSATS